MSNYPATDDRPRALMRKVCATVEGYFTPSAGGGGAAAIPASIVVQWDTGTTGNIITDAVINANTHSLDAVAWTYAADPTQHTYTYDEALTLPWVFSIGGTPYSGGSRCLGHDVTQRQANAEALEGFTFSFPPGIDDCLAVFAFKEDTTNHESVSATNDMVVMNSGAYSVFQSQYATGEAGTASGVNPHNHPGAVPLEAGPVIPNVLGTKYVGILIHDHTNQEQHVVLCNAAGVPLGSSETTLESVSSLVYTQAFWDYLGATGGGVMKRGDMVFLFGAQKDALLNQLTLTAPTFGTVIQAAPDLVLVPINSGYFRQKIERNSDGGVYSVINGDWYDNQRASTATQQFFADLSPVNGATHRYRVASRIYDNYSDPVISDPVTVNNSATFTWGTPATSINHVATAEGPEGRRGVEILVGANNINVTHLGAYFHDTPGDPTYLDVVVYIYDSTQTEVASVTVPLAGHAPNAENFAAVSYTLLAGQTYFIMRQIGGYSAWALSGVRTVTTGVAAIVGPRSEFFTDLGGNNYCGGVNFKFSE